MLDIEPTRKKLESFIRSAASGHYYKPMEAVGREAAIEATSVVLGEDSMLGALAAEVRELRGTVTQSIYGRSIRRPRKQRIKHMLGKIKKQELWPIAQEMGYDTGSWGRLLSSPVPEEIQELMQDWPISEWREYIQDKTSLFIDSGAQDLFEKISDDILEEVAQNLPSQPWDTGVHKEVAEKLSLSNNQVSRSIAELIRQGRFKDQVDGTLDTFTDMPAESRSEIAKYITGNGEGGDDESNAESTDS